MKLVDLIDHASHASRVSKKSVAKFARSPVDRYLRSLRESLGQLERELEEPCDDDCDSASSGHAASSAVVKALCVTVGNLVFFFSLSWVHIPAASCKLC